MEYRSGLFQHADKAVVDGDNHGADRSFATLRLLHRLIMNLRAEATETRDALIIAADGIHRDLSLDRGPESVATLGTAMALRQSLSVPEARSCADFR